MSYRLKAVVVEGGGGGRGGGVGRQSKGCYRQYLDFLNRVYS